MRLADRKALLELRFSPLPSVPEQQQQAARV